MTTIHLVRHGEVDNPDGILMKDGVVPYDYFWHLAIWAFGIFIIGFVFFWQAEERFGRDE